MLSKLSLPVKVEKRGGCTITDARLQPARSTHEVYFLGVLGRYSLCCLYPMGRAFTVANLVAYMLEFPQA